MPRNYEEILNAVLNRIPDKYDKREGSVLYEAVAPLCAEITQLELEIESMRNETFIATATGEYLDMLAKDYDIVRKPAIPVIVKSEIIGGNIAIGNKFSSIGNDAVIYLVDKIISEDLYELKGAGIYSQANYYTGEIAAIDYVGNPKSAKIINIIAPQSLEENDDDFRTRIQNSLISEAADGNVAQYKKWLSELSNIGKSKIYSLWNGANTVKCLILNTLQRAASKELIEIAQEYFDPGITGLGNGKAPIGAFVTIVTAIEKNIDIVVNVVYREGINSAPTLRNELEKFMGEIALDRTVVSYLQVGSIITNNKDIDYITALTLNGATTDISISDGEIPILGALNVN